MAAALRSGTLGDSKLRSLLPEAVAASGQLRPLLAGTGSVKGRRRRSAHGWGLPREGVRVNGERYRQRRRGVASS